MMPDEAAAAGRARTERSKSEGLKTFRAKPEIKMVISLLPPLVSDTQRDCFDMLIRCAFEAGHDTGTGDVAASLLEVMLKPREKR